MLINSKKELHREIYQPGHLRKVNYNSKVHVINASSCMFQLAHGTVACKVTEILVTPTTLYADSDMRLGDLLQILGEHVEFDNMCTENTVVVDHGTVMSQSKELVKGPLSQKPLVLNQVLCNQYKCLYFH